MATADTPSWLQIAQEKRRVRDEAIQKFIDSNEITQENISDAPTQATIDNDNVDAILQAIRSSAVTATALCTAYIRRAIDAHRRTNCLTEVLFDDALSRARELDEFFKANGRLAGPLHGVPMTLKDQFDVQGVDSTLGYVGRAGKPAAEDSVIVALLKQMGAIIIAKSNLPQSIMWCETENPLWGLTTHPDEPTFTPGGSSGGEGTLLALKGSVVGWGTDIGGSIRIPCHMLGLYGLKPSSTRLPYHGVAVSTEGQEHVPSVIGPMTRNIESLISTFKTITEGSRAFPRPWDLDPKVAPLPWRSGVYIEMQTRPLVIGIMRDDGVVKPHPPVARVLNDVAKLLKEAGHELVEWSPGTLHQECINIMDQFYTADGGEDIRRDVEAGGEPYVPHVEALVNKGKAISVYDYWQLNRQKLAAQMKFFDKWNSTVSPESGKPIDILLSPVMPHSAVPHRGCKWVGYTKIFNLVDYPAVVIPAGNVDKAIDSADLASYEPRNELDKWNAGLYDLEKMNGMPIGVQIVARRLEEEKVLAAAKVVSELIKTGLAAKEKDSSEL